MPERPADRGSTKSPTDEVRELTGPEKAVLLLLSLNEATAAPVVAELEAEDVQRLWETAQSMRAVPASALDQVYKEFLERSQDAVAVPKTGLRYLRRVSSEAFGEEKAQEIFGDGQPTALARVVRTDPTTLGSALENEHPQLVAAVLSQMRPSRAAEVLESLPEPMRAVVLQRLGAMTELPGGLLEEVAAAILNELPDTQTEKALVVDGIACSAALVRSLSKETCEMLLGDLEVEDENLASEIRRSMYSFEDLLLIDPRSMRELLKAVPGDRLTMALKTASNELQAHIFGGMSKRAADRMREDLELLGAVRLAEVEQAQRDIVEVALKLESEGTISMGGDSDKVV